MERSSGEQEEKKKKKTKMDVGGVEIEVLSNGKPDAKIAKANRKVFVQYVGRLKRNNKVFDKTGGKDFSFKLGAGKRGSFRGCLEASSI